MRQGRPGRRDCAAILASAAAVLLPLAPARGGTTWDGGGGDNDWTTIANWNPDGLPPNTGAADITFTGSARPAPNLDTNWNVRLLNFTSSTNSFTLNSSTNHTLTLSGIVQNSALTQTINHDIALNSAASSFTWLASAGHLVVNGDINTAAQELDVDGGKNTTFAGTITGSGPLIKHGTGTLRLNNSVANSFTGGTSVPQGTLELNSSVINGAIPGDLSIGGVTTAGTVRLVHVNQIDQTAGNSVTINPQGLLDMNGFGDGLNDLILDGGDVALGGATINLVGQLTGQGSTSTSLISGSGTLRLFDNDKFLDVANGVAVVDIDIAANIAENGGARKITKGGAGTLRLGGANTFTGGVQLNDGTLILGSATALGTGTIQLFGGTLTCDAGGVQFSNNVDIPVLETATITVPTGVGNRMTASGVMSGGGNLTVTGAAASDIVLVLAGNAANTRTGTTTVTNGFLRLSKAPNVAAIVGPLVVGDDVGAFASAEVELTADGQTTSAVDLTVHSDGVFFSSDPHNTAVHSVILNGGAIELGGSGTLTLNGSVVVNSAGNNSLIEGPVDLAGGTRVFIITSGGNLTLLGDVSNGQIDKAGSGRLLFENNFNDFAGGLQIDDGTVAFEGDGTPLGTGTISLTGGQIDCLASNATLANNFHLETTGTINTDTQAITEGTLTLSGVISDLGSFTKIGPGELVLSNSTNTYSGATTVSAGLLTATTNALGSAAGGTTVAAGATLQITQNFSVAEPLTLNGSGAGGANGSGALVGAMAAGGTFPGHISLASASTIASVNGPVTLSGGISIGGFQLTFVGPGNCVVTGAITGSGSLRRTGSGTLILGANDTYGGATNIEGGSVHTTVATDDIPDTSTVTLANTAGVTLQIAGTETIGALTGGGTTGGTVELLNPSELRTGANNANTTFAGVITGAAAANLTKVGAGTFTLSNTASSFVGLVNIEGGTLRVIGGKAIPDADTLQLADVAGAAFNCDGPSETIGGLTGGGTSGGNLILTSGTLTINQAANTSFAGATSGSGAINKTGSGTLTLTGSLNHTGATLVGGGKLTLATNLTTSSQLSLTGGANVELTPLQTRVIKVPILAINSGCKLNLQDNKLITASAIGSFNGSTYTGVSFLIASGRNGGGWNGSTGIITSQTQATTSNFTSIGVATAAQVKAIASTATAVWAGQTVTGSDTLVMYTYGGDANLDGKINVDDYGRIDFNVNLGTSGWFNGDFNYDGKINVDDYGIIDFNVGIQGAPFSTAGAAGQFTAVAAVPEPGALVLMLSTAAMLWPRRRGARWART